MSSSLTVAVVGATGLVGQEALKTLTERNFPVGDLRLFASKRSEGKQIRFKDKDIECRVLRGDCFEGVDIAFFDVDDPITREWVPAAANAGTWVVDSSSTFRLEKDIPLIVPEVNRAALDDYLKAGKDKTGRSRIIAGPNCSTSQLVLALKPILDRWGLERLIVSTYQSVSGAGMAAIDELKDGTVEFLEKKESKSEIFPHPIAFNCIPHIGGFDESGFSSEERKMEAETRKILGVENLPINITTVRVPTFGCHAESIYLETKSDFEVEQVREALSAFDGVVVQDDLKGNVYPTGLASVGKDEVFVGRVRRDRSVSRGLNLWVVSDNLRKGAALNAIQIGEIVARSLL